MNCIKLRMQKHTPACLRHRITRYAYVLLESMQAVIHND